LTNINQQKLLEISSLTSKILRKNFGRGPESCHAFHNHRYLVMYIRGFLSPMEAILLENGNADDIDISRRIVMKSVLDQLKGILELEFEQEVNDFYHDWNYPNNTGMITVIFKDNFASSCDPIEFQERVPLIEEIVRISMLVQKRPDQTEAFRISPKVYLVFRKGILVPIEKALLNKGYEQTLLVTKDDLEKTYYHRDGRFDEIFNAKIADIFVDWNLSEDQSMICLVVK
jgi:uncharacterized protein YbcI